MVHCNIKTFISTQLSYMSGSTCTLQLYVKDINSSRFTFAAR